MLLVLLLRLEIVRRKTKSTCKSLELLSIYQGIVKLPLIRLISLAHRRIYMLNVYTALLVFIEILANCLEYRMAMIANNGLEWCVDHVSAGHWIYSLASATSTHAHWHITYKVHQVLDLCGHPHLNVTQVSKSETEFLASSKNQWAQLDEYDRPSMAHEMQNICQ